jgi:hypothetical protein
MQRQSKRNCLKYATVSPYLGGIRRKEYIILSFFSYAHGCTEDVMSHQRSFPIFKNILLYSTEKYLLTLQQHKICSLNTV